MKKICSITVTYNRKKLLRQNITLLLNQTYSLDKIYIIDNCSTDGTYEYIKDIIDNNNVIKYIKLPENLGGSAGFYAGIKYACEDKMDFLWGMDDDAFPENDAVSELINVYNCMKQECCLCSNCNDDNSVENVRKVYTWMFVGFFIPRKIVEKVGLPRNDFFIYHDDSEYAYRIIKNGFDIYKVNNSIIHHGDMNSRPMYKKKLLGKQIMFPKMPDWKLYYYARNEILKYNFKDSNKYKTILINQPKEILKLVLMDRHQARVYIKGYCDGLKGVTGKIMSP